MPLKVTRMKFLAVALVIGLNAWPAMGWMPEQELTPGYDSASQPVAITIDAGGKVHCVYSAEPAGQGLHLLYRALAGTIWSDPVDLPGPNHKEVSPEIVVGPNGHIHVAAMYRLDGTTSTPYTVFYWEFDGASWLGPTMLSSGTGTDSNNCSNPRIAIDQNGDLHTIWSQDGLTGGEGDILYRKRQGGVWQATQNVTTNNPGTSYGSSAPDLAVDPSGTTVHVVWHDDFLNNGFQAYYTKNTNLGASSAWQSKSQWFQLSTGDYGKTPRVVLDAANNPHAWWTDKLGTSTTRQAYRHWTGTAWSAVEDWSSRTFQGASIDSAGVIRYLYVDYSSDNELHYTIYTNGSFSTAELVSSGSDTLKADGAAMTVSSTNVFSRRRAHESFEPRRAPHRLV